MITILTIGMLALTTLVTVDIAFLFRDWIRDEKK